MSIYKTLLMSSAALFVVSCASENTDNNEKEMPSMAESAAEKMTDAAMSVLPEVPEGVQALSLFGQPLSMPVAPQKLKDDLTEAKAKYDADPMDADNIIWYGRRTAYTGDFRRAIEIFTEGIEKHPNDARMYRHRGHRYITIREFDRSVADYEKAVELIQGTEDKIEPDGVINPAGIFLTSTHSNIYYHLGLAYYLKDEYEKSLDAFKKGQALPLNDDNLVSTAHWIYMNLRLLGREEEAQASLANIQKDMNIVENMAYHNLTLLYKGEIPAEEVLGVDPNNPSGAGMAYGAANWYVYNGEPEKGYALMEEFLKSSSWGAFGYIAVESDLKNRN